MTTTTITAIIITGLATFLIVYQALTNRHLTRRISDLAHQAHDHAKAITTHGYALAEVIPTAPHQPMPTVTGQHRTTPTPTLRPPSLTEVEAALIRHGGALNRHQLEEITGLSREVVWDQLMGLWHRGDVEVANGQYRHTAALLAGHR